MGKLAEKKKAVALLKEKFDKTQLAIVTDYRGFTVKEIGDLRKRLIASDAEFKIAKNTLIKHAIKETNLAEIDELLKGPTAMLIGYGDPASSAKTLFDFVKEVAKGSIKGGVFEGKKLTSDELKEFANLPSKDVLLGQIAGLLVANVRGIACIFEGLIRDNALLIEEVAKRNGTASVEAPKAEAPVETEVPKVEEMKAEEKKDEGSSEGTELP